MFEDRDCFLGFGDGIYHISSSMSSGGEGERDATIMRKHFCSNHR